MGYAYLVRELFLVIDIVLGIYVNCAADILGKKSLLLGSKYSLAHLTGDF